MEHQGTNIKDSRGTSSRSELKTLLTYFDADSKRNPISRLQLMDTDLWVSFVYLQKDILAGFLISSLH